MRRCAWLLLGCCLVAPQLATAGSANPDEAILPPDQLIDLTRKVEHAAAQHGARVFLLARVGRPPSELPEGVEYTHVSFGVYSRLRMKDGTVEPGYAIYNLYQTKNDLGKSELVVDYTLDFVAGAQVAKVGILIPDIQLQKKLYEVITSDTYTKLHNPSYSAISNPFDTRYQNCTEFALDVINAAIYSTADVEQLKANAREYFPPRTLRVNPLKLMLGSLFSSEVRTGDQDGPILVATFGALADYLRRYGLVREVLTVSL